MKLFIQKSFIQVIQTSFRITMTLAMIITCLGRATPAKAAGPNIPMLDMLLALAILRAEEEYGGTGGVALRRSYEAGNKHLGYATGQFPLVPVLVEPKLSLYFDLDDYYSSLHPDDYLTLEGSNYFVTTWIDAGAQFISGGLQIGVGITQVEMPSHADHSRSNEQDPPGSFEGTTFLSSCLGISVTSFQVDSTGQYNLGEQNGACTDIGFSIMGISTNLLKFELATNSLWNAFGVVFSDLSNGQTVNQEQLISRLSQLMKQFVENDPDDSDPSNDKFELMLKITGIYPFTPSDAGTTPTYGIAIDYLHGGFDINSDKIPDNYFPYINSGLAGGVGIFDVKGHSIGNTQGDYYVKLISAPDGWAITANVTAWLYGIAVQKIIIEDVNPGDNFNARFAVISTSYSPAEGLVIFEYGHESCFLFFCSDKVISTEQAYLHRFDSSVTPLPNTPPAITITTSTAEVLQGTPITINATVTDTDLVSVQLDYSNDSGYHHTAQSMINTGGNNYQAVIPGSEVIPPSIQYRVVAFDSSSAVTSPSDSDRVITVTSPAPPPVTTHSVSGYVRTGGGSGISGVTVSIGDLTTTTLSNGSFTISGVPEGMHVITPSKYGFTFSPSELEVNVTADLTGQLFTGASNRDQDTWVFPSTASQLEDTYIFELDPGNNFGSSSSIAVGNAYISSTDYRYWGLLRFDELKSTLSGMEVYNARLDLYVNSVSNRTTFLVYGYNNVSGWWDENTVTWNSFLRSASQLNSTSSQTVTSTGWRSFDVTTMTNEYVERYPNYGFVLWPSTLYHTTSQNYASIRSSESGSNAPLLTVKVLTGTPDLAISRIYPTPLPSVGNTYEVGQTMNIGFDVYNHGPGGANLTHSCLYLESNPNSLTNQIDDNQSARLLAGSTDNEDYDYTFVSSDVGTRYIAVKANCTGEITETDTDNNINVYGPIHIVPVNNAPVLNPLPDQSIDEDVSAPTLLNLWDYASDTETSDANLVYTITNNPNPAAGVLIVDNHYLAIVPPGNNWNGYVDVLVQVTDAGGKTANDSLQVTVNLVNDPPVINGLVPLPSQSADANTPIIMDLTQYESDPEDSGTNLDWDVSNLPVEVTVSGEYSDDDVLTFTPDVDFGGTVLVTFHLVDSAGLESTQNVPLSWSIIGKPILTSPTATSVASTTATLGANITSDGGSSIIFRGTCWGTAPSIDNSCQDEYISSTGIFTQVYADLLSGTHIYYHGYAANSTGVGYSPEGSFYTEPMNQAYGVNITSVTSNSMTINWSRGNGDGAIVLMKAGEAVSSDPTDGTYSAYIGNSTFTSGTQIGSGNFVIYKGTGTSVSVSGLSSGTTYYVAVYEYKGTVDTSGGNQGTNYKGTPTTGNQTTYSGQNPATFSKVGPSNGATGQATSLTLSWNAASPATFYQYCYSDSSGCENWTTLGNVTSVAISGLDPATTYYWQVQAYNGSAGPTQANAGTYWSFTTADITPPGTQFIIYLPLVIKSPSGVILTEDFNDGNVSSNPTWTTTNTTYHIDSGELNSDGAIVDQSSRYLAWFTLYPSFHSTNYLEISYRGKLKQPGNPQAGRGIMLFLGTANGETYSLNIQNGYTSGFSTNQHCISVGYAPPNTPTDLITTSYAPNFNQVYGVRAVRQNGIWYLYINGILYNSTADPGGYTSFSFIQLITTGSIMIDDIVVKTSP